MASTDTIKDKHIEENSDDVDVTRMIYGNEADYIKSRMNRRYTSKENNNRLGANALRNASIMAYENDCLS